MEENAAWRKYENIECLNSWMRSNITAKTLDENIDEDLNEYLDD